MHIRYTGCHICDLQLVVLVQRQKCTTAEDGILMPQHLDMLPICGEPHTLLDDGLGGVLLQVEQVMCVLGTPVWKWGPRGRTGPQSTPATHCGEAALTQGGEGDECRLLDSAIELTANDGSHPRVCGAEGYHQANHPHVQAMGCRQAAAVERVVPIVAETKECVVQHSWKTRAVLAYGNKSPILSEGEVGVVVLVHLKIRP
jgi:hypothetical protein